MKNRLEPECSRDAERWASADFFPSRPLFPTPRGRWRNVDVVITPLHQGQVGPLCALWRLDMQSVGFGSQTPPFDIGYYPPAQYGILNPRRLYAITCSDVYCLHAMAVLFQNLDSMSSANDFQTVFLQFFPKQNDLHAPSASHTTTYLAYGVVPTTFGAHERVCQNYQNSQNHLPTPNSPRLPATATQQQNRQKKSPQTNCRRLSSACY